MSYTPGAPASATRRRRSLSSLQALDFGLRVRIEAHADQRHIFSGAESLSVQELASELSEMVFSGAENLSVRELTSELSEVVSSLRVRSFALRADLEQVTSELRTATRS